MHLRSNGRLFHSFGAAATKARSPRVGRVLKLGFESRYLLFDLRLYEELGLKLTRDDK